MRSVLGGKETVVDGVVVHPPKYEGTYTHTHVHTYTYTHRHTRTYANTHIHTYMCIDVPQMCTHVQEC